METNMLISIIVIVIVVIIIAFSSRDKQHSEKFVGVPAQAVLQSNNLSSGLVCSCKQVKTEMPSILISMVLQLVLLIWVVGITAITLI